MRKLETGPELLGDDWKDDERFQQLVELAPDGILIHDGGRIVLANASAARLAGAAVPTQLVGLPIDTFLDPPYLKAVRTQLTGSIDPLAYAPPVRDTFHRLDGSDLEVEVRAVAFVDHGRPSAHLVVRDITERLAGEAAARQMETRLHEAQRMESVGALAGGVAHEVNNMMAVVLGFSDFLLKDFRVPDECLPDVREIIKAAERAATVTRQLLAFSRRAVHRPEAIDLGAAVRAAEPVVRRLLGEDRQLVVETSAIPGVWVDPGQLEQVIINLALNASDAMPGGGTLTMTTSETELPDAVARDTGAAIPAVRYAALSMRDTGSGMDAAIQQKIFEPFYTTKPIGKGTGLGLAAVQGILKQHNGYITVSSAPGEGAEFTVYLPILPVAGMIQPGGAPPPADRDTAPRNATVMVVDDEPGLRSVVVRTLTESGFRVIQAADGSTALDLIDRHGPPELVLTDLTMPGLSGGELARRLKERWPALPVLFMSGYSAEELRWQGAAGPAELIQKPFSPDELVVRVAAALLSPKASDPALPWNPVSPL